MTFYIPVELIFLILWFGSGILGAIIFKKSNNEWRAFPYTKEVQSCFSPKEILLMFLVSFLGLITLAIGLLERSINNSLMYKRDYKPKSAFHKWFNRPICSK